MAPICLDGKDSSCKVFTCPSCFELYETDACRGGQLSPAEVCRSFRSYGLAGRSVHDACVTRPIAVCDVGGEYIETDPDGNCIDKDRKDPSGNYLPLGTKVVLEERYYRPSDGEAVSSACSEFTKTLGQTIAGAALSALCTLPVSLAPG